MIVTLKFLHLFSLLLGGATSVGNLVLGELTRRSGAPPTPVVAGAMSILMKVGLAGLLLLWLTGLPLAFQIYGALGISSLFTVKLILATLALALSLTMTAHIFKARKSNSPPNARLLLVMGRGTGLIVVVIIALSAGIFAT